MLEFSVIERGGYIPAVEKNKGIPTSRWLE